MAKRGWLITVVLFLCLPQPLLAGTFMLSPVKSYLEHDKKIVEVRIANLSDERLHVQVEGYRWTQDDNGHTIFGRPEGLVFFPKIFSLEPKTEKTIRIGYKGRWPEVERAYRIFVRELPVTRPGETTVKVAMRISSPVFVVPRVKKVGMEIERAGIEGNLLVVRIKNTGNVHLLVKKFLLEGYNKEGNRVFEKETAGWYVLAERTVPFRIKIRQEDCLKMDKLKLTVKTDTTESSTTVDVTDKACKKTQRR